MGLLRGCSLFSLISHFKNQVIFSSFFLFYIAVSEDSNTVLWAELPPVFLFFHFCSLLFSLFAKTSYVPPKPSFPTHFANRQQYSVADLHRCQLQHGHQWYVSKLSALPCSFPQPMSGPQFMVQWKWPWVDLHCLDPVYTDCLFVCLYYPSRWHCFCLYECVIGYLKNRSIIGEYEYVHMWTLFFLLPYLYMYLCLTLTLLFSQENNLTELWRTIRTKVGKAWKSDRVTSSAGAVTK